MAEEEQEEEEEDENKRIRPRERARGQKIIDIQKSAGKVRKEKYFEL